MRFLVWQNLSRRKMLTDPNGLAFTYARGISYDTIGSMALWAAKAP